MRRTLAEHNGKCIAKSHFSILPSISPGIGSLEMAKTEAVSRVFVILSQANQAAMKTKGLMG